MAKNSEIQRIIQGLCDVLSQENDLIRQKKFQEIETLFPLKQALSFEYADILEKTDRNDFQFLAEGIIKLRNLAEENENLLRGLTFIYSRLTQSLKNLNRSAFQPYGNKGHSNTCLNRNYTPLAINKKI